MRLVIDCSAFVGAAVFVFMDGNSSELKGDFVVP